ncbi:MAG: hypothetical protein ACHQNV_01610 [Vicinamibacteria bacterium]
MRTLVVAWASVLLGASPVGPQHFTLSASYVPPARPTADGSIAVTFTARDADVHINENPPTRLRLDPEQKVLVDKQPPAPTRVEPFDPDKVRYIDLALPVLFPVSVAPGAPKGIQSVKATVVYFYCSKSQGWCRRGSTDIDVSVNVR